MQYLDYMSQNNIDAVNHLLRHLDAMKIASSKIAPAIARQCAPEFSPFEFVRQDELGLSQIIRWLFDAQGSHGQRGLFLRAFLDHHGQNGKPLFDSISCDDAVAKCEVITTLPGHKNRRIDILVEFSGHCLAIENKPWADWQEYQLGAYLEDISQPGRYEESTKRRIVALKGWLGEAPAAQLRQTDRAELIDTDYAAFADMLRDTIPRCKAEPVRRFLEQFVVQLEHHFKGISMTILSDQLTGTVLGDTSLANAAFDLLSARSNILLELRRRFENDLREKLGSKQLQLAKGLNAVGLNGYQRLEISQQAQPTGPVFAVEFYKDLSSPCWGLPGDSNGSLNISQDLAEALAALGLRQSGQGWLAWSYVFTDAKNGQGDPNTIWASMYDGDLVVRTVAKALEVFSVMDGSGSTQTNLNQAGA